MTPIATCENPRIVTLEAIEAFEKATPALIGIGEIMVEAGIWTIEDYPPERVESA
ncbi:MAG: hypothetical protein JXA08_05090 [Methanomicrobiaceae archaeon]|nr:hypothetical protein [Methanomicrobiaceae archaeon]